MILSSGESMLYEFSRSLITIFNVGYGYIENTHNPPETYKGFTCNFLLGHNSGKKGNEGCPYYNLRRYKMQKSKFHEKYFYYVHMILIWGNIWKSYISHIVQLYFLNSSLKITFSPFFLVHSLSQEGKVSSILCKCALTRVLHPWFCWRTCE